MAPETHDGAAEGGTETRWVELVVALLICAGGVLVMFDSARVGATWGSYGPQAGYFPMLTGTCLLAAGVWIAVATLYRWRKLAGVTFVTGEQMKPVMAMLLPTIAYIVAIRFIGIYLASAIFIGAFMVWKGRYRMPATLSVSLGVPAAMFLLFEIWFLVPLPKGPFEKLIGY